MCCVMPPASPETTLVSRMASSRLVLPWSTWPMIVTTGARGMRSSGASSNVSSAVTSSAALVIVISRSSSAPIISTASFVSVCVMPTSSPRPIMIFWICAVEMPSAAARSLTVTPERTVAGPVGAGTSSRRSVRCSPRPRRPRWRVSRCGREAAVSMTTRRRPPSCGPRCGPSHARAAGRIGAGAVAAGRWSPTAGRGPLAACRASRSGSGRGRTRGAGRGRRGLRRRRGGGGRGGRGTRRAIGAAAAERTRCRSLVDGVALQAHAGLGEAAGHLSGVEPALAGNVGYTLSRHLERGCYQGVLAPSAALWTACQSPSATVTRARRERVSSPWRAISAATQASGRAHVRAAPGSAPDREHARARRRAAGRARAAGAGWRNRSTFA